MKSINGNPVVEGRVSGGLIRHQIRENLQHMILSGQRQPGSRLRQQELAKHFGVAQGVVREALLELQASGLVETIDNRGIFVGRLDKERLLESFDVRGIHEGLAARLCCERASRSELRPLEEVIKNIYLLAMEERLEEMGLRDREFHKRLTQLSRNSMLIRLADNYRVLGKFIRASRDPEVIRDEHLGILEAIDQRYPDKAERLMREHIAAARLAIEKGLDDGTYQLQWMV